MDLTKVDEFRSVGGKVLTSTYEGGRQGVNKGTPPFFEGKDNTRPSLDSKPV